MSPFMRGLAGLGLLASWACAEPTEPRVPAEAVPALPAAEILAATGVERFATAASLAVVQGAPMPYGGYEVRPVAFDAWPGFRASAALWRPDGPGPFPGVLVLPGHFGEGKSAGECQEVAHALAARGMVALAVDMPGMEEWDLPGRQVHFEGGIHNRAVLRAAGLSALGLQLAVARRGLAVLREVAPVDRVAVAGASGGAVLAFYLALAEPGVRALVAASPVTVPREVGAGGCFCDTLPGVGGPAPAVLAALEPPSLWLSDRRDPPPVGLPPNARWEVVPGHHSFTVEMRELALPWLDAMLAHEPPDPRGARRILREPPYTAGAALRSPGDPAAMSIFDLARSLGGPLAWVPELSLEGAGTAACVPEGPGPVALTLGAEAADLEALAAVGLAPCPVVLDLLETWESRAVATGHALVEVPARAVRDLASDLGRPVAGIYAVGPGAVLAATTGLPWVARDPLRDLGEVVPASHPAWVHVPGGWWGGLDRLYAEALALGTDPAPLAAALLRRSSGQASTTPPASDISTPASNPGGR